MPELPEVETIARQLRGLILGRTIRAFESSWERVTDPLPPAVVAARLAGRRIAAVRRRGKLVVLDLDDGLALVVSLRMTGRLLFRASGAAETDRFVRARLAFTDGSALAFSDVRKMGRFVLVDAAEIAPERGARGGLGRAPLHRTLGREPLTRSFTPAWLGSFLGRRRRAAIKPLLLDGRGIAGIGNIYASEALWRARIHPLRPAGSLRPDEVARLHEAVRGVLRKAIRRGGSSLSDYVDARGQSGRMQREFEAYGRAGEPCSRCGREIARTVIGARSTFHCRGCQPAGRPAR